MEKEEVISLIGFLRWDRTANALFDCRIVKENGSVYTTEELYELYLEKKEKEADNSASV